MLPFSEVLFQDFLFSGVVLLIVNGISNLTAVGFAAYIFFRQETFADREKEHLKNADERVNREDTLIVYFSRMGYVRHYAYELRQEYHADIYEVKSTERTEGTLGFWWCGRFGMHRWHLPMEQR